MEAMVLFAIENGTLGDMLQNPKFFLFLNWIMPLLSRMNKALQKKNVSLYSAYNNTQKYMHVILNPFLFNRTMNLFYSNFKRMFEQINWRMKTWTPSLRFKDTELQHHISKLRKEATKCLPERRIIGQTYALSWSPECLIVFFSSFNVCEWWSEMVFMLWMVVGCGERIQEQPRGEDEKAEFIIAGAGTFVITVQAAVMHKHPKRGNPKSDTIRQNQTARTWSRGQNQEVQNEHEKYKKFL